MRVNLCGHFFIFIRKKYKISRITMCLWLNCYPWAVYCKGQHPAKAHPALFEGEGEQKNEALLFQSTVDIHFQIAHKTKNAKACTMRLFSCKLSKTDPSTSFWHFFLERIDHCFRVGDEPPNPRQFLSWHWGTWLRIRFICCIVTE